MRNKIFVIIISAVFTFLLLWCPAMAALDRTGVLTFQDNRNYIAPEKTYDDSRFLSGVLNTIEKAKAEVANIYTNYLPAYNLIIQNMSSIESSLQVAFVDMLAGNPAENKASASLDNTSDASDTSDVPENTEPTEAPKEQFKAVYVGEETHRRFYAIRPYDFLESVMKLDEASLYKNMKGRAEEINRLIAANTDVDFYLYIGKTMQDEEYFNDIIPDELCTAAMFKEFMDTIKGAAGKDAFKIGTVEDRLKKQWRTDHHWNAAGSYDVYCDIINMVSKNTPEIGKPVEIKEVKTYPNIKMRGSYAALSGYSNFYEEFFAYEYDLPESRRQYSVRSRAGEYAAGNFDNSNDIFLDHYVNYYHTGRHRYVYENNTGRNLLIIGDSLTYWSAWLIAANFDNTYLYFPWDGQTMDYNQYIKDNGITDVLMMVYSQAGIFNVYGYCTYEQLRTR